MSFIGMHLSNSIRHSYVSKGMIYAIGEFYLQVYFSVSFLEPHIFLP